MEWNSIISTIISTLVAAGILWLFKCAWGRFKARKKTRPAAATAGQENERIISAIQSLSLDARRQLWKLSIKGNPIALPYESRNCPVLAMLENAGLIRCVREGSHHDNFTDLYAVDDPIRNALQKELEREKKPKP